MAENTPTLNWGEEGYTIKLGDKQTRPFKKLDWEYATYTATDQTQSTYDELKDILDSLGLPDEERSQLRKTVFFKCAEEWRKQYPRVWIGKAIDCFDKYMCYLEKWVKHDEVTRQMVFLTALSAYSDNPLNLFIRGPSAIGKSYVVTQTMKLFPKKTVMMLGGLSPTALVHDFGKLVNEKGEDVSGQEIDWQSEEGRSLKYVVDLSNKTLVFLEAPHSETYMRLRPILSHDMPEIEFSFTDKAAKGTLRTRHVFLRGWPATIFCTTSPDYQEELSTRSINITPEMTEEKYADAILMQGKRSQAPWDFHNPDPTLLLYTANVEDIKREMGMFEAIVPFGKELAESYPHTQPRDMRDYSKLTAIVQQLTFFHLYQRPWLVDSTYDKRIVLSTLRDLKMALRVFSYVSETTRSGLPGNVISFFNEVMVPLSEERGGEISFDDVASKYSEVYHQARSKETLKKLYLNSLEQVGWLDEDNDPEDRRKILLRVIGGPEGSLDRLGKVFSGRFREAELERWVAEDVRSHWPSARLVVGGVECDWAEFSYRYFVEWV